MRAELILKKEEVPIEVDSDISGEQTYEIT